MKFHVLLVLALLLSASEAVAQAGYQAVVGTERAIFTFPMQPRYAASTSIRSELVYEWSVHPERSSYVLSLSAYLSGGAAFSEERDAQGRDIIYARDIAGRSLALKRALGDGRARYEDHEAGRSTLSVSGRSMDLELIGREPVQRLFQHRPTHVVMTWYVAGSPERSVRVAVRYSEAIDEDTESRWTYPVGFGDCVSHPLSSYRVESDMLDPEYGAGQHTGEDWNRGSGDNDLGDPVCSIADGVVVASDTYPDWSNVVVIRHELPDGRTRWSQYAHLNEREVEIGARVRRGQRIGTIGRQFPERECITSGERAGFYCAHLHFEIRRADVPADYWPNDAVIILEQYLDPTDRASDTRPEKGFIEESQSWTDTPSGDPVAPPPPPPEIFEVVEQMPELQGGLAGLQSRIQYPEMARRAGIEGRVFVQFVVDEQGNPTDVRVSRGIGGGCDEAAMAAVRASRFTPGLQRGRLVKVRMSLPVTCRLN